MQRNERASVLNSPAWDSLPGRGREEVVANWPKRNKAVRTLHWGLLMGPSDLLSRSPQLRTETFEAAPPGFPH